MAVKYVKDFGFDSGFGFSGSSGKTPVRAYMRGGAVKKSNPTKAPSIAPAMVEKRSQGLGGLAPETKKLAAYNKPHMEGKKGAKVPQYAKGGAVKKKMPSFLKAKMMKKADGGAISQENMARKLAAMNETGNFDPYAQRSAAGQGPPGDDTNYRPIGDDFVGILPFEPLPAESIMPTGNSERLSPPPEMPPQLKQIGSPLSQIANAPSPVKPIDYSDMPMGVMGGGDEYWRKGGQKDQQAERSRQWEISKGLRPPDQIRTTMPVKARTDGVLTPPAAAARMAPQDRRAMRADRREMARDIMDRYIAGPRRAMPAPRRAMPVAPRAPMVEPAMIRNPRMPVGGVATFAKGGKVSKGQAKVGKVMGEFKRGELHSGSKQGPLVTNPKQAKAIALSEARKAGAKIPKKAMGGRACG